MNKISIKQVISESFRLYQENFGLWFLVSLLAALTFANHFPSSNVMHGKSGYLLFIGILGSFLGNAILTILVADKIQSKGSSAKEVVVILLNRILRLIGTNIIFVLILMNGVLLFIIPVIYLSVLFEFSFIAVIVDDLSPLNAMRASCCYVRGNWWRVFFISLLTMLVLFLFLTPFFYFRKFFSSHLLMGNLGQNIITAIVTPFVVAINVTLYYKLRTGKDFQALKDSWLKYMGIVWGLIGSFFLLMVLWAVGISFLNKNPKQNEFRKNYALWSMSIRQVSRSMEAHQYIKASQECQSALDKAGHLFYQKEAPYIFNENLCGNAYLETGKYDRAQELLLTELQGIEAVSGKESIDTVDPLNVLARLYIVTNQKEKAEQTLKRLVGIYEKSNRGDYHKVLNDWKTSKAHLFGPFLYSTSENLNLSHQQAQTFNRLRQFYQENGRLAEAEAPAQKAIEIFRELNGPDDEIVESISLELAKIYRLQGKWQAAAEAYEKALHIYIKKHGQTSFKALSILESMLAVYKEMGNSAKVEECQKRIDDLKQKIKAQ